MGAVHSTKCTVAFFAAVRASDGRLCAARQLAKPQRPLGSRGGGALALLSKRPARQLLPWHGICHFQRLRWEHCARLYKIGASADTPSYNNKVSNRPG